MDQVLEYQAFEDCYCRFEEVAKAAREELVEMVVDVH